MIEKAYAEGVPMGSELSTTPSSPDFLVSASKDPGSTVRPGTDLQRLQIIKGWLDDDGATHEKIYEVAGTPGNGAGVDPATCATTGSGHNSLCTVWRDPDFDGSQPAFYYVRVLENPTCRWSTLQCQAAGVNPFARDCAEQAATRTAALQANGAQGDVFGKCCLDPAEQSFYTPTIQERAWTSPIWINPNTTRKSIE